MLTLVFECYFVDLPIVLDDIDGLVFAIDEGGDLLGALVPPHLGALVLEGFDEDDGLRRCHCKSVGECLVVEGLNSLFVDC